MKLNSQNNRYIRFAQSALALCLLVGVGCAQEIGDINRIQPNYVDKDIFNGEWYQRTVVVDKQHASPYPFIGYEGDLTRIRWEITQTRLLVFRSHAMAPGAEGGDAGDQTLIAAFPIRRHFDIRRQYNPINGQENNVIQENDFDRPWWERDYMRVDWSQNVVQDYDINGWVRFRMGQDGATARAADSDPTNPWRVRISDDYIETTIEANSDAFCCNATGDWL